MVVYRITQTKYAKELTASGQPNRWNKENQFVIYIAQSKSLCVLELLANRTSKMKNLDYSILEISLPIMEGNVQEIEGKLPDHWKGIRYYSMLQNIGSGWYRKRAKLILKVPSVLMSEEYNYVLNTEHPDFDKVEILSNKRFEWDSRIKRLL